LPVLAKALRRAAGRGESGGWECGLGEVSFVWGGFTLGLYRRGRSSIKGRHTPLKPLTLSLKPSAPVSPVETNPNKGASLMSNPLSTDENRIQRIADLNDLCRTAMGVAGIVIQTPGIAALSTKVQSSIREAVERFDAFTEDNDPYGERDFGAFRQDGHHIFWKIDYYNPDLTGGSEDPADPAQTCRVLTIMLACEY
jgi:hypothetical protein